MHTILIFTYLSTRFIFDVIRILIQLFQNYNNSLYRFIGIIVIYSCGDLLLLSVYDYTHYSSLYA